MLSLLRLLLPVAQPVTCGTCRWWEAEALTPRRGYCRGVGPSVVGTLGGGAQTVWPATASTDWCAHGTPRDGA